jgi:hypothetical protein
MNNRAQGAIVAALVFIVIVVVVVAAVFFLPLGQGYKVHLTGGASYTPLPASWYVSYSGMTQERDVYLLSTEGQPGLWIWDTGGIIIEVVAGDYKAEKSYPAVSSWLGGSLPDGWSVDLRHVEPGSYSGTVNLYEVVGSFFGIGGTKTFRTSTSISFTVNES